MALTQAMRALAGAICLAVALPHSAMAEWPEKRITLVHGFGAGGNADVTSRVVADRLTVLLGQEVVVEQRPGAGGRRAAASIARAKPDGYTLLMLPGGHAAAAALHKKLPYDPVKDFTFIGQVTEIPFVVATYPEHAVKSVPDLIAAAKKAKEPIIYSTSGTGTGQHLAAELFAAMAEIKLKHLPSKGGNAVPTMLLGKHIGIGFEPPPGLLPLIADGKLRAIATTGPERFYALPDVPTIGETVKGYKVTSYFGVAGPANMPADVVKKINGALVTMLKEPKTIERLRKLGSATRSTTPEGFKAQVEGDIERWTKLVKDVGIKRK